MCLYIFDHQRLGLSAVPLTNGYIYIYVSIVFFGVISQPFGTFIFLLIEFYNPMSQKLGYYILYIIWDIYIYIHVTSFYHIPQLHHWAGANLPPVPPVLLRALGAPQALPAATWLATLAPAAPPVFELKVLGGYHVCITLYKCIYVYIWWFFMLYWYMQIYMLNQYM
jgi:hypothetical protein